jgi:hypothetical protein
MKMNHPIATRRALLAFSALCFLYHSSLAQTSKDYFFPSKGKNASVFRARVPGSHSKYYHNKTIFYDVTPGDSARMTTQYFDDNGPRGGREDILRVGESEITRVRTKANTSPGTIETFGGHEILFKMPAEGAKSEWENPDQPGAEKTVYVSEFTTLKIGGKKVKAVKVLVKQVRKRSGKELLFYVDYYVAGMGLYKTTDSAGRHDIFVVAEQKYEPNIPGIN